MNDRIVHLVSGCCLGSLLLLPGRAKAQEARSSYFDRPVPVPSEALELKLGTAYAQGFGMLAPGRSLPDVAGAGLALHLDADYRVLPKWSLGVEAQYQQFSSEQNTSARGFAASLGATYHFSPELRGDPWLRLGTGYRLLWENDPSGAPGSSVLRHGFELATAKLGYDVRISPDVAIAPVIGADVNLFLWQDPSNGPNTALSTAQVGTFVFAGLQGRFDVGGKRSRAEVASAPSLERAPVAAAPPPAPTTPVAPSIAVSPDVLRACQSELGSTEEAPKFAFDESDLTAEDLSVLAQIAQCFTTGPLNGEELQLIGRADPRGTVPYNQALGSRRALSAAAYLESRGVDAARIVWSSRGKLDAMGHDEASWAIDRRVDILEATESAHAAADAASGKTAAVR